MLGDDAIDLDVVVFTDPTRNGNNWINSNPIVINRPPRTMQEREDAYQHETRKSIEYDMDFDVTT